MSEKTWSWQENEVGVGASRFDDDSAEVVCSDRRREVRVAIMASTGRRVSVVPYVFFSIPPHEQPSEYPWVRCQTVRSRLVSTRSPVSPSPGPLCSG